jgi:hypothetical protein
MAQLDGLGGSFFSGCSFAWKQVDLSRKFIEASAESELFCFTFKV